MHRQLLLLLLPSHATQSHATAGEPSKAGSGTSNDLPLLVLSASASATALSSTPSLHQASALASFLNIFVVAGSRAHTSSARPRLRRRSNQLPPSPPWRGACTAQGSQSSSAAARTLVRKCVGASDSSQWLPSDGPVRRMLAFLRIPPAVSHAAHAQSPHHLSR